MGRKLRSKKVQLPEPGVPNRRQQVVAEAGDRFAPGSEPPVQRPNFKWAICGLLLLAVFLVFGQTSRHQFVNYDDDEYVYQNDHVMGGLAGKAVAWAFTARHAGNWHPLTWLSHMLDCELYGVEPRGHHLTNVVLHAVTAILLFLALQRMTGAVWPSAWVAAVFAIHPLRVESVAWVAERKDVLSGLFCMLTLCCYARYAERPSSGRYLPVLGAFALGLMAKPMLVTLPFVLLLLDYWPLGRFGFGRVGGGFAEPTGVAKTWPLGRFGFGRVGGGFAEPTGGDEGVAKSKPKEVGSAKPSPTLPKIGGFAEPTGVAKNGWVAQSLRPPDKRLLLEKIPLFVLAAASCLITLSAQSAGIQSLKQLPFSDRLANAATAYVAYLGKMFYPNRLAVFYPHPKDIPASEVIAAVAVLLAISTAVFLVRRRCPYLLVGWLWYLGTLAPVIGLVQVGAQAMADRYTYLSQIGLYVALAWGAVDLAGAWPWSRWGLAAVSAILAAALMGCAWQQTGYWRDSETLWTHALDCNSRNSVAHNNLGLILGGRGQVVDAIAHYREALEIEPRYAVAHNNLGVALAKRGEIDEAIDHYRKAIQYDPNYAEAYNSLGAALAGRGQLDEAIGNYQTALKINPDYASAHNNLAAALKNVGKIDDAVDHYRRALAINPNYAEAHTNLGAVLCDRGRLDEAIAHHRKALKIKPDYADAYNNLGIAAARDNRLEEAIGYYQQSLQIKSDNVQALNNLGGAFFQQKKGPEAVVQFKKALAIDPNYFEAQHNLAMVLAEQGRNDEAIEHYQKALELALAQHNEGLAANIRARITKLRR